MKHREKRTDERVRSRDNVTKTPDGKDFDGLASLAMSPTVQGAFSVKEYGKRFGNLSLSGLTKELSAQTEAAIGGDLTRAEAMLIAQAHTLDAIFNNLAQRAVNASSVERFDRLLKLGLKAQAQCTATWAAIGSIKNPPTTSYVRQANISHGHQQVNNGVALPSPVGLENEQNKLLEQADGERLDTRATSAAGAVDTPMEALGTVHRTEDA